LSLGQSALKPITDIPSIYWRASKENFDSMSEDWKEVWEKRSLIGKAWSALKGLGSTAGWVMTPAQAAIESVVGEPVERTLNLPGTAKHIGEWGSFASQLAVDPLAVVGRGLGAARQMAVPKIAEKMFSASTRSVLEPRTMPDPFNPGGRLPVPDLNPWATTGHLGGGLVPQFKNPVALRNPNYGKQIVDKLPSPAQTARRLVKWGTQRAISGEQARFALEPFQKLAREMPPDVGQEFILHMLGEGLQPLPTGLQPMAKEMRRLIDKHQQRLVDAGLLDHFNEDYFPRQYKNPDVAEQQMLSYSAHSRRPLQGSRRAAGLLRRTVPTARESLFPPPGSNRAPMELITTNPVDYLLHRLDGMDKYYYGTMIGRELKRLPYFHFLREGQKQLAAINGWKELDDKFFEARLPPAKVDKTFKAELVHKVIHNTSFDSSMRQGLEDLAQWLGAKIETPLRHEDPQFAEPGFQTARGYASRPAHPTGARAVSEFGNDLGTLLHEVGHQLDFKYKLWDVFRGNQQAKRELAELARLRWEKPWSALSAADKKYLLDPEEQMANLLHAYWHAPQLLEQIAPTARQVFQDWLDGKELKTGPAHPLWAERMTVKGLVEAVTPRLKMTTERLEREHTQKFEEKFEKAFPGIRLLGKWYAPEPVATVFNNYVSDASKYQDLYDVFRNFGNAFNSLQLSLSAFHYGMISMDSSVSALTGLPHALRSGHWGRAAERTVVSALPIAGPVISSARRTAVGRKFRRATRDESDPFRLTPEFQQFMRMYEVSGQRLSMDMMHRSAGMGGFGKAIKGYVLDPKSGKWRLDPKGGYLWDSIKETFRQVKNPSPIAKAVYGGAHTAARLLETTMEPIMEWFVPNVKTGVFHDMARDWIEKNPGATDEQMMEAAQRISDSVDNRMGQLVYDNLFWSRTLKNSAFLAVRAVGWNLGTEREIGGGIVDAVKSTGKVLTGSGPAEITDRTSYTIALPIVVAMQGAVLNYLYTGEGPRELMDYFFPRNGRLTSDGVPERVSMPSYVKDVFAYNYDPTGTVLNKLHPLWSTLLEAFYFNKDYYGSIIHTKYDPTHPMVQEGNYFLHQMMPFSWRGFERQRREGADLFPLIMSAFGFVPATTRITNPQKTEMFQDIQEYKGYRRRLLEEQRQ
jgi:hypothetical protein